MVHNIIVGKVIWHTLRNFNFLNWNIDEKLIENRIISAWVFNPKDWNILKCLNMDRISLLTWISNFMEIKQIYQLEIFAHEMQINSTVGCQEITDVFTALIWLWNSHLPLSRWQLNTKKRLNLSPDIFIYVRGSDKTRYRIAALKNTDNTWAKIFHDPNSVIHIWTVPEDTVPTDIYTSSYLSHCTV